MKGDALKKLNIFPGCKTHGAKARELRAETG